MIILFSGDVIENLIFFALFALKSFVGICPVITTLFPCSYNDLSVFMKNSNFSLFEISFSSIAFSCEFSIDFGNISNVNGRTTTVSK